MQSLPTPRPEVVVHVGTGKAGSSSIQSFMNQNRRALAAAGHLYARTPGAARHARLALFCRPDEELADDPAWRWVKTDDPRAFRRRFRRRLLAELADAEPPRVIFSEETLFGSTEPTIRRLRRLTERIGSSLRVVAYLRRQDDHLVSRYQQGVKVGEVRRLSDPSLHRDYGSTYDYAGRLALLERVLQPAQLVVRRFERSAFLDGSLFADFLDAAGIDVPLDGLVQPEERNVSLDADAVELLRLVNLYRVAEEGERPRLIDNRDLVRRLSALPPGPTLTLTEADLDAFMERFEAGNREVATRWLGDPDGVLFRTPRKTHGTTAVQRLEPDRLDQLLEVLEVPQRMHAPLRALAAREAAATGHPRPRHR